MNTFKVENDSSDMTQPDPLPLNDDSVKLEVDETENVPDLQNVMTVKTEIDESEIGELFTHVPKPYPKFPSSRMGFFNWPDSDLIPRFLKIGKMIIYRLD